MNNKFIDYLSHFDGDLITGPTQQGHMMQQMPMNVPPHHLQQNGPSHMSSAPNHMHPQMGPHGTTLDIFVIKSIAIY